jgi:DNA-binding NarL/FixJ family response regulator
LASPTPAPPRLTGREVEVLELVAQGLGNKEIAAALHVSENTVKTHVRHILEKLGLRGRAEAAAYAVRQGLIPED